MVLKRIFEILSSLTTGIVWLILLVLFMVIGSITMLKTGGYETINSMPLFRWIQETTIGNSWWLILSLFSLGVITINTILCTFQSLIKKAPARTLLLKISPQIIHVGFLLILLAHIYSSTDSFHALATVGNNQRLVLSKDTIAEVSDIMMITDSRGFPYRLSSTITIYEDQEVKTRGTSSPNHPVLYNGIGFYLKNVRMYPYPVAQIQVSRDSGARWALAGGILFLIGNVLLVVLKWKHESITESPNA